MTVSSSFVVVANRLPVDEVPTEGGRGMAPQPRRARDRAAAGPGRAQRRLGRLGRRRRAGARSRSTVDGIQLHPVAAVTPTTSSATTRGMSNSTHLAALPRRGRAPIFKRRWAEAYRDGQRALRRGGRARSPRRGATVWVQDYQLQLVPAMLRERRPDLKIGFFLHIPFPPVELFMQLPQRAEILRGLLGADLVGFQQPAGRAELRPTGPPPARAARTAGGVVEHDGRRVQAAAFPISIDVERDRAADRRPARPASGRAQIRTELGRAQDRHPGRGPAGLHQGHRAPAQGIPGTARRTADSRCRRR